MCVKLPSRDLNPDPYPPHPTNIYTCKVITAPKVGSDYSEEMLVFCFLFFVFFFLTLCQSIQVICLAQLSICQMESSPYSLTNV